MMARQLDRQTLETMRRADLQRLCKDHGIKANLKTEALVDLLLDTMQPQPRRPHPTQIPIAQPRRVSAVRTTSKSSTGSRPRGTSSSSLIIHDSDDEEDPPEEPQVGSVPPQPRSAAPSSQSSVGSMASMASHASYVKKSRQTQYRLGVGRPKLAGGSGPRAVTKSTSLTKRGKGSLSVQPSEDAIQEEEEPVETGTSDRLQTGLSHNPDTQGPVAGPSGTAHLAENVLNTVAQPAAAPAVADTNSILQIVQPLQDQIGHLQSEVQRLTAEMTSIDLLRTTVAGLSAEVETLRTKLAAMATLEAEVGRLRDMTSTSADRTAVSVTTQSAKSAGKARAMDLPNEAELGPVAQLDTEAAPEAVQPHPGLAAHILGKHPRESDDSTLPGIADAGTESEELLHRPVRPSRKRAKLSPQTAAASSSQGQGNGRSNGSPDNAAGRGTLVTPSAPAFTIFSGPEEPMDSYLDPPPPTTHLSDLLDLPPAHNHLNRFTINGMTATANAPENNVQPADMNPINGFNFSFTTTAFQPMTSTPAGSYGGGDMSFTFPDLPLSPTPVTSNPSGGYVERAGGRIERNDLFHPHGRPRSAVSRPPSRASASEAGPSSEGAVNSAPLLGGLALPTVTEQDVDAEALAGHAERPAAVSSSDVGHVFGLGGLPLTPETPAQPMKRTMYGTELEGDTRFGDFGVEGVAAAGFWVGAAPRF